MNVKNTADTETTLTTIFCDPTNCDPTNCDPTNCDSSTLQCYPATHKSTLPPCNATLPPCNATLPPCNATLPPCNATHCAPRSRSGRTTSTLQCHPLRPSQPLGARVGGGTAPFGGAHRACRFVSPRSRSAFLSLSALRVIAP